MAKSERKKWKLRITERDQRILKFLWKWKVVSTSALATKFFPSVHPYTCYCRLLILEKIGVVKSHDLGARERVGWSIEEKGFRYIQAQLGELESKGFRSEFLEHDFIVSAFHLGEWLTDQPKGTQTFSEQQLRRIHPDLWPLWVPKSSIHRPDGYTLDYRGEAPLVYAFENELSVKAKHRYEPAVAFYDAETSIAAVFWLVGNANSIKAIEKAFSQFQVRHWQKHNFLLLEDFKKHGWLTQVVQGSKRGDSLMKILFHNGLTNALQSPNLCKTLKLLDSMKRPNILGTSGNFENTKFSD